MPIVGQFGSLAGLGSLILPGGAFESIATVTVGSGGAADIEFTSIPGTYQHLQIRLLARGTNTTETLIGARLRFNGDSAANYASHNLRGDGSSAAAGSATSTSSADGAFISTDGVTASIYAAAVIDILDYANTSKYKVWRSLTGFDANGSGRIYLASGLWMSTSAVTSLKLIPAANNFKQHSTFALFGLRAP